MSSRSAIIDYVPYLVGATGAAALVFAASLFGILTRPEGLLAVLWPANALLVAAFVRVRVINTPLGWIAAFGGYIAADLVTGSDPVTAIWLTAANMAGVAVGVYLIGRLNEDDRTLARPLSVLYLCLVSAAAAFAAGIFGIAVAIVVFDSDPQTAFLFWACTEFANYVVILPFALSVARWPTVVTSLVTMAKGIRFNLREMKRGAPALSLLVSMVLIELIGGPGAVVFPVPALLWCALSYRLPVVAFLIVIISHWLMVELELELLSVTSSDTDPYYGVMSARLGIAMLALGPLTVASIDRARSALVARLDHAANHDFLTGLLTRGALMSVGRDLIARLCADKGRLTVMVMDLDHFKRINDSYGHATGDRVLVEVSKVIHRNLRGSDVFARLGGEEFCLLLPDVAPADAHGLAQRIRSAVEETEIQAGQAVKVSTTVSIGLVCYELDETVLLDTLISDADKAMYEAKSAGRNRVVMR